MGEICIQIDGWKTFSSNHLEDKGVDERIILKGILWKQDGRT
jgi:hypothetical protein